MWMSVRHMCVKELVITQWAPLHATVTVVRVFVWQQMVKTVKVSPFA